MTTFDERERAIEAKFADDETFEFKVQARRDRMLAEWAGARLGYVGDELKRYVVEVWRADLQHAGDEDVFTKVIGDFDRRHLHVPAEEVHRVMRELMMRARDEVAEGEF